MSLPVKIYAHLVTKKGKPSKDTITARLVLMVRTARRGTNALDLIWPPLKQ